MADFSKLKTAQANEAAATASLKTDVEALIAKTSQEDPAIQAGIDAATTASQANADVTTALDAEVKAKLGS